ncbi:protein of unknown function (plasmid) [Methylorubrum extorquens DM4]|uniref:CHAT domain-containing protein n=1 Tax=Methylorubrum extorquens (strain DSM 6343 / CIP 106787 / DM4) TaxID=661410 RepID=C7CMZ3_METED|nr:CHAT domain-containing protein [Methylorubrum extorquens]CAX17022.1 protein of unknown function [Methylorubrum extorquens DM4]
MAAVWVAAAGAGCLDLGRCPALSETIAALRALLSEPTGLAGLMAGSNEVPPRTIWTFPDGSFRLDEPDTPPQAGARVVSDGAEFVAALSRRLLAPLPAEVFATRRLLISPDGPLTAIPFEALVRDGRRLIETHEVTYLASLSLAASRTSARSDPETTLAMVAIGASVFEGHPDLHPAAVDSALAVAARRCSTVPTAWADLPGAAAELAAVTRIYGLIEGETRLTGKSATIERVRDWANSGRLGRAAVILLASHGHLDPRDPRRNALVLGRESPTGDGLLTAAELASYDLSADLVVLSACDSGAGPYQAGEGLLGLPFALTAAGCRSVVQTLWPIYDAASAILVARFFTLYRAGESACAALTLAKREMSAGDHGQAYVPPAYWAPYLLYGREI